MPRGSHNLKVSDADWNSVFARRHGDCDAAREFEGVTTNDVTVWAVFRELTTQRYPVSARRTGAL